MHPGILLDIGLGVLRNVPQNTILLGLLLIGEYHTLPKSGFVVAMISTLFITSRYFGSKRAREFVSFEGLINHALWFSLSVVVFSLNVELALV